MSIPDEANSFRRILVVIPNWVGDVVLATPVLAALREQFADARITYLMRSYVADVLAGGNWHDSECSWPMQRGIARELRMGDLARRLRGERFDVAILLTNSFRSALLARLARIPRRVGFARDGRGWLLSRRLKPLKENGQFVPAPVTAAYAEIAHAVGCDVTDRRLRLGVSDPQEQAGVKLLKHYGLDEASRYAVINPGAAFGAAKCWLPERFSETADRLAGELGLRVLIVGAPKEAPLMRTIASRASSDVICMDDPGTTLGSLKVVIRNSKLLVCNDTGPRHYGNAFGVPTVTIFGPTHRAWTDTHCERETIIQMPVDCGPCQLRTCPLDHRCMKDVTVEMVIEAAKAEVGRVSTAGSIPGAERGG